ncbi:MAG TPA: alpha-ketoacid dehydrogenase subunit beta [Candidatus Binatia bacterium]|jgi:pyruvate dehydrogenase E1 component beta subunit|nr:alpha-ketoacid dehydrogenase subunit beta [Candidatus Binatia bacterium]
MAEGREMRLQEALREALRYEMERDPRVFVMGEDVALFGGAYGVTRGLMQEYGEDRVRDTPISEAALVGLAAGAAINGMRPVVEIQFCDLLPLCMDQLVTHAARWHYMTGGRITVPLVIRNKFGTRAGGGPSHSSCNHGAFIPFPGLKIIAPTTPADAKGLLLSAIRDPNPVLCFESHHLYGVKGQVPDGDYTVPIGKATVRRQGRDLTIVTCGGMVLKADAAAEKLRENGVDVEVVDLRSLAPLDTETILASVAKTKRALIVDEGPVLGGLTAELAAMIQENLFSDLKAPVVRVGAAPIPPPHSGPLVEAMVPSGERIESEALRLIGASAR